MKEKINIQIISFQNFFRALVVAIEGRRALAAAKKRGGLCRPDLHHFSPEPRDFDGIWEEGRASDVATKVEDGLEEGDFGLVVDLAIAAASIRIVRKLSN